MGGGSDHSPHSPLYAPHCQRVYIRGSRPASGGGQTPQGADENALSQPWTLRVGHSMSGVGLGSWLSQASPGPTLHRLGDHWATSLDKTSSLLDRVRKGWGLAPMAPRRRSRAGTGGGGEAGSPRPGRTSSQPGDDVPRFLEPRRGLPPEDSWQKLAAGGDRGPGDRTPSGSSGMSLVLPLSCGEGQRAKAQLSSPALGLVLSCSRGGGQYQAASDPPGTLGRGP